MFFIVKTQTKTINTGGAELYKGSFFEIFRQISDSRQKGKVRHEVLDVFFIVISGVICGCNEWDELRSWAIADNNFQWLKKHVLLMHGIPSVSTIKRIFYSIEPKEFELLFESWANTLIGLLEDDVISIDGKTMRGSHDKINGKKGIHIVSALCNSHGLVIGHKTDGKSNEITAISKLLDMLFIEGCIATIDGPTEENHR